ncbi:MAG: type III polyketide synthase [bacterium]|nr:type III polyketide synthase [bacterium]
MPYIHCIGCALPPHYYDQESLIQGLLKHWSTRYFNPDRIAAFHRHVLVGGRHLALPLESYENLQGLQARNDAWLTVSLDLAQQAVSSVLDQAQLQAHDIHLLVSSTVTGIAVPSLEARLMNRLPFAPATKRMPLFGLGCLAGVAGINRAADYLRGHPQEAAIFVSIELCSLTLQSDDLSIPNLISSGLFGDGGAAVLLLGDDHPRVSEAPLELTTWQSTFFPQTERVMGWDIVDSGFKVVLSPEVPDIVRRELPRAVQELCRSGGIRQTDLSFVVAHPGGPKVLQAMAQTLDLADDILQRSWESLARYGNMSSVSVLFVLDETLKHAPQPDALGLMVAMGPAFCAELSLLRYRQVPA